MTKRLFYVPTILIVKAEDESNADAKVEEILHHLTQIGVKGLAGYTLPPSFVTSEAPKDWFESGHDAEVEFINGKPQVKVIEVAL